MAKAAFNKISWTDRVNNEEILQSQREKEFGMYNKKER
jgi:hypothetical protein